MEGNSSKVKKSSSRSIAITLILGFAIIVARVRVEAYPRGGTTAQAEANRVKFGRSKAEKQRDRHNTGKQQRDLDSKKRDDDPTSS